MSANNKYTLGASYLFCVLMYLFISVLVMLCNVAVCAVGQRYSAPSCCVKKQARESSEAQPVSAKAVS